MRITSYMIRDIYYGLQAAAVLMSSLEFKNFSQDIVKLLMKPGLGSVLTKNVIQGLDLADAVQILNLNSRGLDITNIELLCHAAINIPFSPKLC